MTTRRAILGGALASLLLPATVRGATDGPIPIRLDIDGPFRPISPYIYGSNELGTMDGEKPSSSYDRYAGVTARRLGGNLMTAYNWTNNATNAGKDWQHANYFGLAEFLALSREQRQRPAAVITSMHLNSLEIGAFSLVTLPLAGYVAADGDGPVSEADHAPSKRFCPVVWDKPAKVNDPVDPAVANIQQLLQRLIAAFGKASNEGGIRAYALDNEPGLWAESHPRIVLEKPTIADFLQRSVAAARAIKAIDPDAMVFGPASWGVTEFQSFQNAPDWQAWQSYGSFLGAYLDAFRKASAESGIRLLDALDVHWYPQSNRGALLHSEDTGLASVLLDAPRSLTESGFREDSWVPRALPLSDDGGLALPILPSLHRIVDSWYPDTAIAISEYNFGGPGQLASGLALADALGRFGASNIFFASHWGDVSGWLGEAFRLYRNFDGEGGTFGDRSLNVTNPAPERIGLYAAHSSNLAHLVAINRGEAPQDLQLIIAGARSVAAYGFDADHGTTGALGAIDAGADGTIAVTVPGRAARHFVAPLKGA